jgi:trk system potassium uptake protein TrkA
LASKRGVTQAADSVAVIGLGRFGRALALELMDSGTEVLGVDSSEQIVQSLNSQLTHVVMADSTSEEALRQLSVPEFDRVVVAIGSDIQSSILTTSLLMRLGVKQLWAKAVSDAHGLILEQLGELAIRTKYGVTITAVHKPGERWAYTTAETVLEPDDVILITGPTDKAEAFSQVR